MSLFIQTTTSEEAPPPATADPSLTPGTSTDQSVSTRFIAAAAVANYILLTIESGGTRSEEEETK